MTVLVAFVACLVRTEPLLPTPADSVRRFSAMTHPSGGIATLTCCLLHKVMHFFGKSICVAPQIWELIISAGQPCSHWKTITEGGRYADSVHFPIADPPTLVLAILRPVSPL